MTYANLIVHGAQADSRKQLIINKITTRRNKGGTKEGNNIGTMGAHLRRINPPHIGPGGQSAYNQ